ncbi:MAG: hypothetical protein MJZ42_05150, partial [Bacteroidales bacterium]|nr:hypothetical protein [Bacteroidales bacterium]
KRKRKVKKEVFSGPVPAPLGDNARGNIDFIGLTERCQCRKSQRKWQTRVVSYPRGKRKRKVKKEVFSGPVPAPRMTFQRIVLTLHMCDLIEEETLSRRKTIYTLKTAA